MGDEDAVNRDDGSTFTAFSTEGLSFGNLDGRHTVSNNKFLFIYFSNCADVLLYIWRKEKDTNKRRINTYYRNEYLKVKTTGYAVKMEMQHHLLFSR